VQVHVLGTYLPFAFILVVSTLVIQVFRVLYDQRFDLKKFYYNEISTLELDRPLVMDLGWKSMLILTLGVWYISNRQKPVYLVDFCTWEPPESWKVSPEVRTT